MFELDEMQFEEIQQRLEWDADGFPTLPELDEEDDADYLDRRLAGFGT